MNWVASWIERREESEVWKQSCEHQQLWRYPEAMRERGNEKGMENGRGEGKEKGAKEGELSGFLERAPRFSPAMERQASSREFGIPSGGGGLLEEQGEKEMP